RTTRGGSLLPRTKSGSRCKCVPEQIKWGSKNPSPHERSVGAPVNSKLSRRHLLKSIGTAGVASLVAEVAAAETSALSHSIPPASRATNKSDLVRLSSGRMIVRFDRRNGTVYSISDARDALGTNFLGNSDNTLGIKSADTHWTG